MIQQEVNHKGLQTTKYLPFDNILEMNTLIR
jgi:hypothetical protein